MRERRKRKFGMHRLYKRLLWDMQIRMRELLYRLFFVLFLELLEEMHGRMRKQLYILFRRVFRQLCRKL